MVINVLNMKDELINLNKLIDDYEDIYLNIYNEFNSVTTAWMDENANKFFDEIKLEKIKVRKTLDEITSVSNLYEFIIKRYKKIGNKIECYLSKKDSLLAKFRNYINHIDEIIGIYSDLDLSFCDDERTRIIREIDKMKILKENAKDVYDNIKSLLSEIEEIEREINLKISKTDIEIIK